VARPFILATPHHSTAWQAAGASADLAAIEASLAQYEQAITAADTELQQLYSAYQEVLAYYEAVAGGQQS